MFSLFELFPDAAPLTIVDVGAALHDAPPYQPLIDAGRARIIGFEPDQAECASLNRTYGPPHLFLPHFVGDGSPATFHRTNWTLTGSLYEPNTPLLEQFHNLAELMTPEGTEPVATRRLDDIPEAAAVDFLKIDVQGAELKVFRGAEATLRNCCLIQAEVEFVEMYRGQPMFSDVDQYLRSQGFQFHTFAGFGTRPFKPMIRNNDPNLGFRQLLWADAIYVRDWMRLDALPDAKLTGMAVLLHDLVQSWDLARVILRHLDARNGSRLEEGYMARMAAS